jgi:RimJ/RimL family protein N-acetyltransferase
VGNVLDKLRGKLHEHARVGIDRTYVYKLHSDDRRPVRARRDNVRIGLMRPSSLAQLATIGPFDPAEAEERLSRGDRCYGAWIDGELAHYSWAQDRGAHPIDAAGITVDIPPGELWIYNCRTAEAHRGKGIYPRVLERIANDYFCEGAITVWIYTSEDNIASQHGLLKLGFVHTSTLRTLYVAGYAVPLEAVEHVAMEAQADCRVTRMGR